MSRSRALLALLIVSALGAGAMLLWQRDLQEPIAAPHDTPAANAVPVPEPESPAITTREALGASPSNIATPLPGSPGTTTESAIESEYRTLIVELVMGGRPASRGSVRADARVGSSGYWSDLDPTTGTATFPQLPANDYTLELRDLPPGWVEPHDFKARLEPRSVRLTFGSKTVRIELERGAQVSGTVSLPDGKPVKNLTDVGWPSPQVVFLRYDEGQKAYVYADEVLAVRAGRFEGSVHEGLCIMTVERLAQGGNDTRLVRPVPVLRRFTAGASVALDLQCREPGSARLVGTALDDQGQPFKDLRLEVGEDFQLLEPTSGESVAWSLLGREYRVRVEADGSYAFDGLTPGRYSLCIERGNNSPLIPPERAKIGRYDPPRVLDLGPGETRLDLQLPRARPVHLTGTVDVDPEWKAQHVEPDEYLMISLVYATGRSDEPEKRTVIGVRQPDFDFWVEATLLDPRLELELGGQTLVVPLALALTTGIEPAPLAIRFPR